MMLSRNIAITILLFFSLSFAVAAPAFGPGVTSGGDSCKQNVNRSFGILKNLFGSGKIDLSSYGVSKEHALSILSQVTFQYSTNLEIEGVPVEMINVFGDNIIIVDRKICATPREPLGVYTPLLLHEVVRLMGLDDGADYRISNAFQSNLQQAVAAELGLARNFSLLGAGDGQFDIAWGLDNQDLDFQLLRNLSIKEKNQFLNEHSDHLVNYLVFVPTMTILKVLRTSASSQDPIWDVHGPVSNHNGLEISLQYADYPELIGMSYGSSKWTGSIESLFVIDTDSGTPVLKEFCSTTCDQLVYEAALKTMTAEQKTALAKWPTLNMTYKKQERIDVHGATWTLSIESFEPKTNNSVTLDSTVTFYLQADGSLKIVTGSFSMTSQSEE